MMTKKDRSVRSVFFCIAGRVSGGYDKYYIDGHEGIEKICATLGIRIF